jgi:UDP-N-acetylglucosamine--N-acetylmuramyl-(pentapeptide) pyrophosphoryl-undecaprenol N-acetylglucosamine transferase
MKVIIAGGGTGGHLFPAVAVGEQLMRERPGTEVLFVGTSAGLEAKWLPGKGFRYELLDVHGIRGHSMLERVRAIGEFIRAIGLARATLREFRPDLVVTAGGYASAPIAVAAILARAPIVLMEQNTRPGLSNRMLWRFARKICVGFSETAGYFSPAKVAVTGNPVRSSYAIERVEDRSDSLQILVLGGSSGAHRLNLGALGAFKILGKSVINWTIVHQTGEADAGLVRDSYQQLGLRAEVVPFIDDIAGALQRADLVIARAGAMTVTDIALAARPAIFVPYPFHRDMQQLHNARVIERRGGAIIVADDERLAENLAREVKRLLEDRSRLEEMGRRAHEAAVSDSARRVAQICFEVAESGRAAA